MLDEFREYEEYTCDLSDENSVIRLYSDIFCKNDEMKGLRRALIIISRKLLQDKGYFSENCSEKGKIIEEVNDALVQWTGFSETVNGSWLEQYYRKEKQLGSDEWRELRKSQIKKSFKKVLSDSAANDFLMAAFERVIADAVYFGPLHRYYLVCRDGSDMLLNNNGKPLNPSGKTSSMQIDNVFKLTGLYLIQKKYTGNTYNFLNWAELGHWSRSKEISKCQYFGIKDKENKENKDKYKKKCIKYKEKPIYDSYTVSNNTAKICICQEFLDAGDFKIIDEKDFNGVPEGYTFYSDQGAGQKLAKEKTYQKVLDK